MINYCSFMEIAKSKLFIYFSDGTQSGTFKQYKLLLNVK